VLLLLLLLLLQDFWRDFNAHTGVFTLGEVRCRCAPPLGGQCFASHCQVLQVL
jgi:hypothetical protein